MDLTALPEWRALEAHQRELAPLHLRELFERDPGRAERMSLEVAGLYADLSKHRANDETLALLVRLAEARGERVDDLVRASTSNARRLFGLPT